MPYSILLVEENRADIILAKLEIQRMGFNLLSLDVAESIEDAKTLLSVKQYRVVFANYRLADGFSTELIKLVDRSKTNIIMLSGYVDIEEIKARCGDDAEHIKFTPKPLKEENLEAFADEILIEKKVQRRVRAKCIAFWSICSTIAAMVGGFIAENSEAAKAGFRAFLDVWLAQ